MLSPVERIWRREGLEAPLRRSRRCRLWLANGPIFAFAPSGPKMCGRMIGSRAAPITGQNSARSVDIHPCPTRRASEAVATAATRSFFLAMLAGVFWLAPGGCAMPCARRSLSARHRSRRSVRAPPRTRRDVGLLGKRRRAARNERVPVVPPPASRRRSSENAPDSLRQDLHAENQVLAIGILGPVMAHPAL